MYGVILYCAGLLRTYSVFSILGSLLLNASVTFLSLSVLKSLHVFLKWLLMACLSPYLSGDCGLNYKNVQIRFMQFFCIMPNTALSTNCMLNNFLSVITLHREEQIRAKRGKAAWNSKKNPEFRHWPILPQTEWPWASLLTFLGFRNVKRTMPVIGFRFSFGKYGRWPLNPHPALTWFINTHTHTYIYMPLEEIKETNVENGG